MTQPSILWSKYYFQAALDYLNARNVKPAILVDNKVLKDSVLDGLERVSGDDFVICIAVGFVTNLTIDDECVSFASKFNGIPHVLEIPYHAIHSVFAYKSQVLLEDDGSLNTLVMPKTVLPPGAAKRNERAASVRETTEVFEVEDQVATSVREARVSQLVR